MEIGYVAAVSRISRSFAARRQGRATNFGLESRARVSMIVLIGVALGSMGCREQEAPPPEPIRPIKILSIGGSDGGTQLEFPGTIEAARHSRMGFEVQGRMIEYPVVEGDRLKKGDLLAKLDPRDYQEAINKAQAQANFLETELARRRQLFDQGVDSELVYEKARRNYEVQVANVATAQKALDDTELRAPFDGVVSAKLVKDFVNVAAKEPVAIFEDDSFLKIEIAIPEVDFIRMAPGLTLAERTSVANPKVILSSMSDREFPARIVEIANIADPITRTFRITLSFEKPDDLIINSGMTAKVVATSTGNERLAVGGFLIPVQAALGDEAGKAFVWRVDSQTMEVHRNPVELGEMTGSMVLIMSGLSSGDEIAISGIGQLREGMRVRRFDG